MMFQKARIQRNRPKKATPRIPTLEEFVKKRDYIGAITLLEFNSSSLNGRNGSIVDNLLWKGYCAFHNGSLSQAQKTYIELLSGDYNDIPEETTLYLACVYYYMQMYEAAVESAEHGPECPLKHRILFHAALRLGDEEEISRRKALLTDETDDELTKAAMLYMTNKFQESNEAYKRCLIKHKDMVALNLYGAMCYFKLDYYDVSQDVLSIYEQADPNSITVANLKACNSFRLQNGEFAFSQLEKIPNLDKMLSKHDLLRHNTVVFTDGQRALQILPPLLDFIPEARLNLAIYHLRNDEVEEATDLLKDLEPASPHEYILKAVVETINGQYEESSICEQTMKEAQQHFQLVGASPSQTDTIPGRQAMASYFFLQKNFDEANTYLSSIKSYMSEDDDFNWNYGLSLAASGDYKRAEETLLQVRDEAYKDEFVYIRWLARCFIMNDKPEKAWSLYTHLKLHGHDNLLLELIATDCYRKGYFLIAARAFDELHTDADEKSNFPVIEGVRGACIGVLKQFIINKNDGKHGFPKQLEQMMAILEKYKNYQNLKITIKKIESLLSTISAE